MATMDEVMTTRLTVESFAADFKMPVVPLIAGWMRSLS